MSAEEMARLGAKVLFTKTVAPAVRQGVPIVVRNSRRPEIEGTVVGLQAVRKAGVVKSITSKTGMTVIHLIVPESGMLRSIAEGLSDRFERNQVHVEFVQAQSDGISFAVQSSTRIPELLRDLDSSVRVAVEEDSAMISLVGDGITAESSVTKRAMLAILKDSGMRMASQTFSPRSISFAVPESKLAITVENLHREFRSPDPEIFAVADGERRLPAAVAAQPGRGLAQWSSYSLKLV